MLLVWDLGFSSLSLVVCLVIPLIGFVVRRQWRLAAQRREEIRRLLIRAAEEAARAELDASLVCSSVSVSNGYSCPVCYCPATTRCARCKAVRYCSGKCQIIHWRQGHKEECRPALVTYNTGNEKSDSSVKLSENNEGKILGEADLQCAESAAAPIKEDLFLDKEEAVSVAETTGSSFSGFSSSLNNNSSDDSSICESFNSSDSERLESPFDADIAVESVDFCLSTEDAVSSDPLSPKFTRLVESAHNPANMTRSNQSKPAGDTESVECVMNKHTESTDRSPMISSGFWGRALESVECVADLNDDSASSKSDGPDEESLTDTYSSMHFSFSSLKETSVDVARISDAKSNNSDRTPLTALDTTNTVDKESLSERSFELATSRPITDSHDSSPEVTTSLSTSYSVTRAPVVREAPMSAGPLDTSVSSSVALGKSNSVSKAKGSTFGLPKTEEVAHLATKTADTSTSSDVVNHSPLGAKSGRVLGYQKQNAGTLNDTNSVHERNGFKASVLKVVDQWTKPKSSNMYTSSAGTEMTRKHSHHGLFPYEYFAKLYTWNKLEFQPCGLVNCGNSCYANVVFQCLMFTPPLFAFFLQGLHSKTCPNKEQCFTCGFENLVLKAKEGKSPLYPSGILSQLQNNGICLGNGKEEDAHEFLRFVVDTMQAVCINESKYNMLKTAQLEETTLIGLTFGGYLRSKIKCMKCQGKSERHERMMDLTVEIDGDVSSLDDALRRFTRTEILDGENKYKCGRCKSYERAKKKLKILEPPNVLTIALKRFQSGKFGKLNKLIRFPEMLDLAPYVSRRSDKSQSYRLYGVIVHLDVMNAAFSGHYVCYIKNSQNKWFKADDSTVVTTDIERVLTKGAYMLFYARCSPRPPRSVCIKTVSLNKNTNVRMVPKTNGKSVTLSNSNLQDGRANGIQSFYSKFQRLQKILEEDSSSDSSSLFDSTSDECSCSTDSARDSTSMDDFADFIFGDHGRKCKQSSPYSGALSPASYSPSSTTSSSSSPMHTRQFLISESERQDITTMRRRYG